MHTDNAAERDIIVIIEESGSAPAVRSLNTLISQTRAPYGLIYIDAGSPNSVASELSSINAPKQGFHVSQD